MEPFSPDIHSGVHMANLKPLKFDLLQKLNPANIVKPIHDKIVKVKESFVHPNHPAYGSVQFWSPEHIWEKIHQTGHNFFTGKYKLVTSKRQDVVSSLFSGINGAIFGLAYPQNNDYPFPYRSAKKS